MRSVRLCFLVSLSLLGHFMASAVQAQNITATFEPAADLAAYTQLVTDATVTLTQSGTAGSGSPAAGGVEFLSTTANDRSAVMYKRVTANAGLASFWQQSVLISPREVNDALSSTEKKIEVRLGFATATAPGTNLKEFLHKTNPSFGVTVKAEHKPSDGTKIRKLTFNGFHNAAASEVKFAELGFNDSNYVEDWLRATITLQRTAAGTFDLSFKVDSLGTNGLSAPVLIHSGSSVGVTNAALQSATNLYAAIVTNTDKSTNSRCFLDDHEVVLKTPFAVSSDLTSYATAVTDATIVMSEDATGGTGSPSSVGIKVTSSTTGDKTAVIRKTVSSSAGAVTYMHHSAVFNFRDVDGNTSGESKVETRLGFSVPLTLTGSYKELLHKVAANDNLHVKLKAEHKPSDSSKIRNIEVELTNYSNSEVKYGRSTLNNSAYFDDWLRIGLTAVRTSATTFDISYKLESLGIDGTSTPQVLATFTELGVTNADFGNASSLEGVFLVNSDKRANTTWFDDDVLLLDAVPPAAPVAVAATNITDSAFQANWQAGGGASGYVLEVTTQGNNFAANTFISAAGATGQAAGINITGGAVASQIITGLTHSTPYVYRLRAVNGAGQSGNSNTITAATLSTGANVPPTLDVIANLPTLTLAAPQQSVSLTGISAGFGETGQTLVVTATSSNTAVIAHPAVLYTSPQSTATLTFTPAGAEGTSTVTVTVNDGQAVDNTIVRTFTVTVRTPPVEIAFNNPTDLDEYAITNLRGSLTHSTTGGTGAAGSGSAIFQGLGNGADHGTLAIRTQAYPGPAPTLMRQSIFVNFKEINDNPALKNKAEVRFGFASHNVAPGELKKYFEEGAGKYGVHCKVTAENDPADSSKDHTIKARVTNWNGTTKTDGEELVVSDETIFDHWFKCTFEAVAVGTVQFQLTFKVEDYGLDGTTNLGIVHEGTPLNFVNAGLISAPWIYAGFYLDTEKTTTSKVYADHHRVEVMNLPPETPLALDAIQVTASSFTTNWSVPAGAYPNSFLVEVVPAASSFVAGQFISATGATGQSTGVTVNFADQRKLRFFNLAASTGYKYRVRASNIAGPSAYSNTASVTTLASGSNAQPTLDVIASLEDLAANGGSVVVPLTGVSDGGEFTQSVGVTAVSSNPALIPHPTIGYANPEETGTLVLTPVFLQSGSATITVTVNDGQATNNTRVRTFTVNLVNPAPTVTFNSASDATLYQLHTTQASLTHISSEGAGAPATGALKFERSALSAEHVALGFRSLRYDARVIPHASTSLMMNLSGVLTPTTGSKDKAEVCLGFIGSAVPGLKMKDTFNKTHPSLFAKLKFENDVNDGKDRKLEIEVGSFNGTSDNNSGSLSIDSFSAATHWLRLSFHLVRSGVGTYQAWYTLESCGPDGTSAPVLLLSSSIQSVTNAAFASDTSLYAGFSIMGEKAGTLPFWIDNHVVNVNTTACDAPVNQAAFDQMSDGFILPWTGGILGRAPTAYVVELCRHADNFAPGTLIADDGTTGQSTGFLIDDAFGADAFVSGLLPGQKYLYRVRALRGAEASATLSPGLTQTLAQTINDWRVQWFPIDLDNPETQPEADFDRDGLDNATEYALGRNPRAAEASPPSSSSVSGNYLRMSFRRRSNLQEVLITPQACGDLATWLSSGIVTLTVSEPDENGIETVTVRDAVPTTGQTARFMKLSFLY